MQGASNGLNTVLRGSYAVLDELAYRLLRRHRYGAVLDDPTLVGVEVFFQGTLFDPTFLNEVGAALTGAQKLRFGL